jgi:hypothetical protein
LITGAGACCGIVWDIKGEEVLFIIIAGIARAFLLPEIRGHLALLIRYPAIYLRGGFLTVTTP